MIDSLINIVLLLTLLTVLVLLHELGHFVAARRAGVTVHEFGIGFPPRARVLFKRGDTTYTLNWLPIGGFVRMEGETVSPADGTPDVEPVPDPYPDVPAHGDDLRIGPADALEPAPRYLDQVGPLGPEDAGDLPERESLDPNAFVNQPLRTRLWILFAGVAVNFVLAWLIFTLIALLAQPIWKVRVADVMADSPAAAAGLIGGAYIETIEYEATLPDGAVETRMLDTFDDSGDAIVAIDGTTFPVFDEMARTQLDADARIALLQYMADRPSETLVFTIEHADGTVEDIEATLRTAEEIEAELGALGFQPQSQEIDYQQNGVVEAAVIGFERTVETSTLILRALGSIVVGLFSGDGEALGEVAGPVGMVGVVGGVRDSLPPIFMLWFVGLISANLAVINALPIPPLDGSRALMAVVQRLSGDRISASTERLVYFTGWVALMLFIIVVTIGDIQRLFE